MKNPVAEFTRAHRGGGAVENPEERMLFSRAGIDEVEIDLRGRVDEDVLGDVSYRKTTKVIAIAAELVGEVMHHCTGSGEGGGHSGAAEAVERLDLEMILEGVQGLIGNEGVAVVGKVAEEAAKLFDLFIGDKELRRRESGEFVFELLPV